MAIAIVYIIYVIGAAATANVPGGKQNFPMLRGINRSGTEFACIKGTGIFDGHSETIERESVIVNMKKWNINIVRVPLNEGCWLVRYVPRGEYAGENYKKAIQDWVTRLRSHGLYVIVELHWTEGLYEGPDKGKLWNGEKCLEGAMCQKPMPHEVYSTQFWKEVAEMFKDDEGIIFDLFNEPFPDRAIGDRNQAWKCWKSGRSECHGFDYEVAGMQDLVNAVRDTGAKNLIILGGLSFANDLEGWEENLPEDRENNLAASMHSYSFNSCKDRDCWDRGIGEIVKTYPVIVGEIGEDDCTHNYIDKMMPYLEEKRISYLGWTWNNWNCTTGPSLIENEDGEPTEFGKGFKDFLEKAIR